MGIIFVKILKKLDALDSLWHLNEKSSDIICELKAKNAVLERDNELLINALMLKGDKERFDERNNYIFDTEAARIEKVRAF